MADVSAILAAGDIGSDAAKNALQPLQNMSTLQTIMNNQQLNKLYQIEQQQKGLDLDKSQTAYLGGRLNTAAYLPLEQQTPEMYHQILDEAAAMGPQNNPAFAQKIAYYRTMLDNSSPEMRQQIAMRAGMTFAPPEVQQRMNTPDRTSVNTGSNLQFYNIPKAGMPGANVPTPTGSSIPLGLSPSERIGMHDVQMDDGTTKHFFGYQLDGMGRPLPGQVPIENGAAPDYGGNSNHSKAGLTPQLQALYQQAADKYHIPVELLLAQGRQESNFDPTRIGGAGEIGLGQIKPSTAQAPGMGLAPVDPKLLTDPATNINFQASYVAALAQKLGVDINTPAGQAAVLRAYNGGGDPAYVQHVFQYMPKGGGGTGSVASVGGSIGGKGGATTATNPPPDPTKQASLTPVPTPTGGASTTTPPPAPTQPTAGGGGPSLPPPVSTTSPLTTTQLTADQQAYHKVMDDAPQIRQNIADYTEAYNLVKGLSSGKGLDFFNNKRSLIASLANRFGVDVGAINSEDKAYDLATKILTRIQMAAPGAGQSVYALDTAGHASPNLGNMNHDAALEAIRQNVGTLRQRLATGMDHDPALMGRGFQKHQNDYYGATNRDGFASDFMTQKEIIDRVNQLGGKDSARGKAFLTAMMANRRLFKADIGSSLDQQ